VGGTGPPSRHHQQPPRGVTVNNPFDDEDGTFHVLVNDEGQHSLWPAFVDVPAGWSTVLASTTRQSCIDYVNERWVDMRPRSLIQAMEQQS
jgi:MbtH protein